MSREIKFRAWDSARKKMHTSAKWVEFRFDGDGKLKAVNYHPNGDEQRLPVMQFTGLRDVNGVEIWEKDIASVPGIGKCEVKLCPHYGVVYMARGEGMTYEVPYTDCASEGDYPTILGNIYEHSHLLEGN